MTKKSQLVGYARPDIVYDGCGETRVQYIRVSIDVKSFNQLPRYKNSSDTLGFVSLHISAKKLQEILTQDRIITGVIAIVDDDQKDRNVQE